MGMEVWLLVVGVAILYVVFVLTVTRKMLNMPHERKRRKGDHR